MASAAADRPTVRPSTSFDAPTDAATLKKAMKGLGTDEKLIIQVLGRRTSQQRQQILHCFKLSYGKDLIDELKKELSGQFEEVIMALMTPLHTYLAKELNNAMKGPGTKENTLIQILCTNDNASIFAIKNAYQTLYGHPLETDIKKETSGDFEKLLVAVLTASRDELKNDPSMANSLAQSLYKAGEKKKFGTDEAEFTRIMAMYSFPLLRHVFDEYKNISGKGFDKALETELSGDYKQAMLSIYSYATNKHSYFATALHEAMKGVGTRNDTLTRLVISRCEIDLGNIKDEFNKMFGKKLDEAIISETRGDFQKIILALIQG